MEGLHIAIAAMTGPQMKEIVSFVQEPIKYGAIIYKEPAFLKLKETLN